MATDFGPALCQAPGMKPSSGNHLKAWRELAELTQAKMGEVLGGISKSAVNKIEKGERAFSYEKREKVAKFLAEQRGWPLDANDLIYQPPSKDSLRKASHSSESPQQPEDKEEAVKGILEPTLTYLVRTFTKNGVLAVLATIDESPEDQPRPLERRQTS